MTVEPRTIAPGYVVFAHPDGYYTHSDVGPFVGVVEDVFAVDEQHYLHVRGGHEDVGDLFLPLATVRLVGAHQVHLDLMVADLVGQSWPLPPREAALQASGYWG